MEKNKDQLEKEVMDVLIKLYNDQTGCKYDYQEIDEKSNPPAMPGRIV